MKIKFFIFIFKFFIVLIKTVNSQYCISTRNLSDSQCFNNIFYFDQENKDYRAGHFAINSKGDMIIEYSHLQYRLFYGLKGNGKNYFPEGTKEIEITSDTITSSYIRRYESINFFVSFKDDINKLKEYLMSISSYVTILEIHDFENDIYNISESTTFVDKPAGIYSYIFHVLEIKINNQIYYFCIYIYKIGNNSGSYRYVISIKRFQLTNLDLNSIVEETQITVNYCPGNRITSSIIIDYYNLIAIFYMGTDGYFYASFYNYDLESKGNNKLTQFRDSISSLNDGVFLKSCYLYGEFVAFIYFSDYNHFILDILYLNKDSEDSYNFTTKFEFSENDISLTYDCKMNEFLKIDNNRLVFISSQNYEVLYIILFDFYKNFNEIKVRYYNYDFNNEKIAKLNNELSAFIFNGFLAFTTTALPQGYQRNDDFLSLFILFGYPNGTDFEIDIFPYLMDTGYYNSSNNLYNLLIQTVTINNNIFSYELIEQIKLVTIPDEILFFNGTDNSSISNNDTIDVNYLLKQNENIIKENKYYYLDYQFLMKEPEYSKFYNDYPHSVKGSTSDLSEYFTPKILGGRTNTLKFKLCYNYCKTCRRIGFSEIDQKCETCLGQYSFFYEDDWNSDCIPEGYYFDKENNSIEKCTSENSKFYIDNENLRKICFKETYECPNNYQNYNETSKECKYFNMNNFSSTTLKTQVKEEIYIDSTKEKITYSSTIITYTNEEIIKKIDTELLINYTVRDESIEIKGENNTIFQLTTTGNEKNRLSGNDLNANGVSIIDLGNCETLLKKANNINSSLIIKKYEQLVNAAQRNVQYEVYHPITKQKLNLSICEVDIISLYIPVELDEKLLVLYQDLQKSGYDLFNIDDPFYNDICSPYKSENGTDVLLSDRKNDYYNNNYTTCQSNCEYSSFDSDYKFLKCECKVIVDDIDINDFDKFSEEIYKNFYDILKNSNYKVMKCYKLVFNSKYLKKNIGSFIILVFFAGYLSLLCIYIIKGITPLKKEAIEILNNKFNDVNVDNLGNIVINNAYTVNKNKKKKKKKEKINLPPKKKKKTNIEENNLTEKGSKNKEGVAKFNKKKTNTNIIKSIYIDKSTINDKKVMITEITKKGILEPSETKKIKINKKKRKKGKTDKMDNVDDEDKINYNIKDNLDDLDLNNLTYEKAIEKDHRRFIQIYWSRLKSKHLIIFTFFVKNDHNLIYIKITRFIFLICTNMAMNVMFFFDSSMHKIYLDYGKYNFIQQIPQILYSSLLSLVIEILIGILSYTDINIYYIRQMKEFNSIRIKKIFQTIKIKLLIFFIITFIFFYFIGI